MILIEVDIPGLNESYDFSVDETVPIADIIAEISQLISQKWQSLTARGDDFVLCCDDMQAIMNPAFTLAEYGIENGARLTIV